MGKERLQRTRPTPLERLRAEIGAADRFITRVTWSCAAGMVLWSMLNATPYVRAHVAVGWEDTAFVLPLVVDAAFVGALRADEIASRHGVKAGVWPVLLRLFTGASSVFLNIGGSWEKGDWTGVYQHLVAPGLLVLLAEAGPAWRRSLSAKLATAEREAEKEEREKTDRERRQRQEDEDRQAANDRQEEERQRLQRLADEERARKQRHEDEERALDLEERRETSRAKRTLESRRLDLEEKRITAPVTAAHSTNDGRTAYRHNGMTAQNGQHAPQPTRPATPAPAAPVRVPVAPVAPAPHPGVRAPQARTGADSGPVVAPTADPRATAADRPAPASEPSPASRTTDSAAFARPAEPAPAASVAAAQTAPARVTARLDNEHQEQPPAKPAGPVKDWDLPGLPADCAPGRTPELLTDSQAHARIRYGHANNWAQRRVATFAGRSPSTVHKHMKALDTE